MFENTKNLKVEIVKIKESMANIPTGKCIVDCEIDGIGRAITITSDGQLG